MFLVTDYRFKRWISALLLFFSYSFVNAAELSQTGLTISLLKETNDGILVGFTSTPRDCAGSSQGAHAFMSRNAIEFEEIVTRLMSAKLLGAPVTAYYADIGDCTAETQLLQLSNIEVQ
jgi:hypothetical protein